MASCGPGEIIDQMTATTDQLAKAFFLASSDLMVTILEGTLALWLAWEIARLATGRDVDIDKAKSQLFAFMAGIVVVRTGAYWWELIGIIMFIGVWSAFKLFALATTSGTVRPTTATIGEFVCLANDGIGYSINDALLSSYREMSLWNIGNLLLTLLITVPIWFLGWKVLRNTWGPQLRVFGVGMLAPYIAALGAFPATRRVILTTLKIVGTASAQIALVGGLTGLVAGLFARLAHTMPTAKAGFLSSGASSWLGSDQYWLACAGAYLAWVSFDEFMALAASIAEVVVTQTRGLLGGG